MTLLLPDVKLSQPALASILLTARRAGRALSGGPTKPRMWLVLAHLHNPLRSAGLYLCISHSVAGRAPPLRNHISWVMHRKKVRIPNFPKWPATCLDGADWDLRSSSTL